MSWMHPADWVPVTRVLRKAIFTLMTPGFSRWQNEPEETETDVVMVDDPGIR